MAETLGIVASALQLADMALKFKRLYSAIKHVSQDLSCLAEEVVVLASMLGEIEQSSFGHPAGSSPSWQQCFRLLRSSTEGMNQLIDELEKTLQTHRKSGSIRVYLRKDELERCRDRLERIKETMVLAQQVHFYTQQQEALLNEIRAVAMCQKLQTTTLLTAVNTISIQQGTTDKRLQEDNGQTRLSQSVVRRSHRAGYSKVISYNIRMPRWIFRTGVRILLDRSNKSWGFTIRSYNQVPYNTRVFCLARQQEWDSVRRLLDSGQASPWDVEPDGDTLLHAAAERYDARACAFFLSLGVDDLIQDDSGSGALGRCLWQRTMDSHCSPTEHDSVIDTMSLLLSHSDLVLELSGILPCEYVGWFEHAGLEGLTLNSLSVLLNAAMPNYTSLDKFSRAQVACGTYTTDSDAVMLMLGPDLTLHQAFNELRAGSSAIDHHLLLCNASRALGVHLASQPQDQSAIRKWEVVVQSVIEYECNCTGTIRWQSSLLNFTRSYYEVLDGSIRGHKTPYWNEVFTKIGRIWISMLQRLGADLIRYGAAEKLCISSIRPPPVHFDMGGWYEGRRQVHAFSLCHLVYGPNICDWFLYVVPVKTAFSPEACTAEYETAGRFWDWVENPELYSVPGAFITDDEDDVWYREEDRNHWVIVQSPTL